MSRPPKPQHLVQWLKMREALGPEPQCCHTCDHFTEDGRCELAGEAPPIDYINNGSAECEQWEQPIPF